MVNLNRNARNAIKDGREPTTRTEWKFAWRHFASEAIDVVDGVNWKPTTAAERRLFGAYQRWKQSGRLGSPQSAWGDPACRPQTIEHRKAIEGRLADEEAGTDRRRRLVMGDEDTMKEPPTIVDDDAMEFPKPDIVWSGFDFGEPDDATIEQQRREVMGGEDSLNELQNVADLRF
jgi:hypothetical protein